MRRVLLVVAVLLLAASAHARDPAPDIQQFKPVTDVDGFLVVHDASLLPQFRFGVGLTLNYAVNPLEVQAPGFGRQFGLIDGIFGGDLAGSFAIFDFWEVGILFPFMQIPVETDFVASSAFPGRKVGYGFGDLVIDSRIRILDPAEKKIGLAINPWLSLPTGNERVGLGRGLPGTGIKFIVSQRWKVFHFALNAGYAFFARASVLNLTTGNEFTYGAGVGISPVPDILDINLELDGSLIAGPNERDGQERFFNQAHSPAEVLLSVRAMLPNGLTVYGGAGKGISNGYGTPDVRVFGGVAYAIRTPRDRDKDGLHDKIDACVSEPEDIDDYQDDDGCPDPDNDGDGVPDETDACRDVAEDADGWEDADGCPDPDNDGDGVPDTADSCPNDAEDLDGFQDEDGCVEPDNDLDGILDTADTCPLAPEDMDGFQDTDGCPDPDNDGDGVLDADDLCPDDPEDLNGVKDADGCPDATLAVKTKDSIVILEKVFFATGRDRVLRRSKAVLAAVADVLNANPEVLKVRVEGHTDDVGDEKRNLDLSQRRAESVQRELVKLGVSAERLEAVGYGETRPLDTNRTDEGRERNRRVEFTILVTDAGTAPPPENLWGVPTEPARPTPVAPAPVAPQPVDPADLWGVPKKEETPPEPPKIEAPAGGLWGE